MSNEMKENILKYFTNNVIEEDPDEDLVYSNTKTITTNLATQLNASFTNGFDAMGIVQGKNINGNQLNYSVLWGNYTSNSNTYGFFAIIDEYANLIQIITEFASEVKIGEIYTLNVDEEGYFYMIEKGVESGKNRFVMLNNLVVKLQTSPTYIAKIRRAYAIPTTSLLYSATQIINIIKSVGQGRYCIFASRNASSGIAYAYPMVTELVINVGSENEWNDYDGIVYHHESDGDSVEILGTYANWVEDNLSFIILALPTSYNGELAKYYNSGTTMNYNKITFGYGVYTAKWMVQAIILNNTRAYFCYTGYYAAQYAETHVIYLLDLENNTANDILYSGGDFIAGTTNERLAGFILDKVNNEIFFLNTRVDDILINTYYIGIGRFRDDMYAETLISSHEVIDLEIDSLQDFYTFYVNKQFNLYNFNILLDDNTYNVYQIYNSNNYNGTSFNGVKSLLPNSGILYDENDNVIFARNLYNKTINGQTTVSTIEVPNTYINNITIAKQDLLSFNNNTLISNVDDIVTNQYETLDINFINKISILNNNNPNNPIYSTVGAIRLNDSMSNTLDYANCTLSKVRLNYDNNTSYVKSINPPTALSTYVYQFRFNIYVPLDKNIVSVDLISGDGETIYINLPTPNLTKGTTYAISQDVEIQ